MELLKLPEFSIDESKALLDFGFTEEELKELNSLKEELNALDTEIERAVTIAAFGLTYFIHSSYKMNYEEVSISETTGAYKLTGDNYSQCAIVQFNRDQKPIRIMYGVHINNESIKVIENITDFDFYKLCKKFKELSAYSFMVRDDNGKEEEKDTPIIGEHISATVIRPLKGNAGFKDVIIATSVKGNN